MSPSDFPRFVYPVMLDLSARPCLVVGGGAVAERKVEGLVEAGARVTVVSPSLTHRLLGLATDAHFRWRPREYVAGDAEGFVLVMVATDDMSVNALVAAECRERGILIKRSTSEGQLSVIDVKQGTRVQMDDIVYVQESWF